MNFIGEAKRLDKDQLARMVVDAGYEGPEILAVLETETSGSGFDAAGRPAMLFEPHRFYMYVSHNSQMLERATAAGVAYPKAGQRPYPRDSYPRLQKAMAIDADAALRSASWGLGQIMGYHYKNLGYDSPLSMVEDFMESEAAQMRGVLRFIETNGIKNDILARNWRAVATKYNGPMAISRGYHDKLARAYTRLTKRKRADAAGGRPTLRMGDRGADVMALQLDLHALGYPLGAKDGIFGRHTRGSVLKFQADHALVTDGVVGPATWAALVKAKPAPERDVDEPTLRARGSSTIDTADKTQAGAVLGGGALTVTTVIANADKISAGLEKSAGLLDTLTTLVAAYWPALLAIGAAAFIWVFAAQIKRARVRDARRGYNLGR